MVLPNATKSWRRATPNTPEPEKTHITEETPTGGPSSHTAPSTASLHQRSTVLLVLLLQPHCTNPLQPHCTNPLQSCYSPTPTTLLHNPLQPHCTNPLQSYYSSTPTTLLHNPLQSHCTNRDPLQQHPYHESPDGRGVQDCQFTAQQYSCSRMDGSNDVTKGFDINQSMVLCFNELGCGEAALRKFSAITAIPGLAHNTYRRLSKKVGVAHTQVTANVLTAAVRAVNDAYTRNGADDSNDDDVDDDTCDSDSVREDGDDADGGDEGGGDSVRENGGDADGAGESDGDSVREDGGDGSASSNSDDSDSDGDEDSHGAVIDVTVSFDGKWHKRGFTSNYGVGIVIDVMTGLVLDYEVLSKYCHACTLSEKTMMTEIERAEWRGEHDPVCEKNYTGSSKGMEKEAALRMWRRSIENSMRYTNMLSDGDSVAYKAVCDEKLYRLGSSPSSNLQQYQATQDLRCSQADDCAPAKKRARKANKSDKKRAKRTQEKGEGQTYGPGML
ncbi:hypothetical protein ACOMHN_018755 [Nucella lapillus]